uniref:Uncharacterized protein n=1 Tax=Knipowitschia caucasica TaxID=637954 RepID=A0AAV2KVU3_KNICA
MDCLGANMDVEAAADTFVHGTVQERNDEGKTTQRWDGDSEDGGGARAALQNGEAPALEGAPGNNRVCVRKESSALRAERKGLELTPGPEYITPCRTE